MISILVDNLDPKIAFKHAEVCDPSAFISESTFNIKLFYQLLKNLKFYNVYIGKLIMKHMDETIASIIVECEDGRHILEKFRHLTYVKMILQSWRIKNM